MPLRSFTPTERILSERKRMDFPLLVTVWVGVAAHSLAEGRWFYLLAATFAVTINMLAVRGAKEVHVRRLFVNIGVVCATVILVIEVLTGHWLMLQAVGHYLILLQLCKLFERKTNRDYVQILALSALSIIAATMIYHSLLFASLVGLYLVLLCHTAMIFTIKRGLDGAAKARLVTDADPPGVQQVAWNVIRTWPRAALRRRGALILTSVLAVGALMFFITPRSGASPSSAGGRGSGAETGFTGRVRLGDHVGKVYQSNTMLLHVRFKAPPDGRVPAGPAAYLRGATFSRYSNSEWSNRIVEWEPPAERGPLEIPQEMLDEAFVQEVSMDSSLLPRVFTCFPPVRLKSPIGEGQLASDMTVAIPDPESRPAHIRYTVHSMPTPLSDWTRTFLQMFRDHFPPQMPRDPRDDVEAGEDVKRLARRWCSDLLELRDRRPEMRDALDLQIARRIAQHLQNEYTYTLDLSQTDPSRDGVEDFLFHTKRGHCEYFASAMTVMCRTLGVQARLVTGFVPDEYDSRGDYYIIRGRDAHAWTEVFTPTTDWVPLDATPPGGREIHGATWWAPAKKAWSHMEFLWYERVVGYDAPARRRAGRWVRDRLEVLGDKIAALGPVIVRFLAHGALDELMVRVALLVGLMGMIVEGVLVFRWTRRALRRRRSATGGLSVPPSRMKFLRTLLSLLARKGLRRRPEQTLREFAADAAVTLHLPTDVLDDLIALSYRVRWGREVPPPDELHNAELRVARLGAILRG